jgi:hypothetical protein
MKRVLGLSLGSSKRDKTVEIELLGERISVERRGTDGDVDRFRDLMTENDGKVDALCVGGANLALHWRGRHYPLTCITALCTGVKTTPLVDGSGVKGSLEPYAVGWLADTGFANWRDDRVLIACAVDRFGLSDELRRRGARHVVCGDLMFNLGVPIALRGFRGVDIVALLCLPLLRRLPMRYLYPTGHSQDEIVPKHGRWYAWADVIAGDFLIIRRHLPEALAGKLIVTNTTTPEDMELLRARGVRGVVTTSLRVEGRSFGTNVFEGVLTCLSDKPRAEMTGEDFLELARRIGWAPEFVELNRPDQ